MNRFWRQHLSMRWASSSLCIPLVYPLWNTHTISPSFCVANNSLFSKPSLSDLTTKYPSCFQNTLKNKKLWTSSSVIFPFILLTSSSDSVGILCTIIFVQFLIKFAKFNADFISSHTSSAWSVISLFICLLAKCLFFSSSSSKLQKYFDTFSPSYILLALERTSTLSIIFPLISVTIFFSGVFVSVCMYSVWLNKAL